MKTAAHTRDFKKTAVEVGSENVDIVLDQVATQVPEYDSRFHLSQSLRRYIGPTLTHV